MVMAGVTGKDPETADLIFDRFDTDYISDYDGEYDDVEEGAPPAEGTAAGEAHPTLCLVRIWRKGGSQTWCPFALDREHKGGQADRRGM